ncbi:MAG: sugar phosphate isomerase/epimerase family protein [Promethearchaeota archaeon]
MLSALNQATLMKASLPIFLESVARAGYNGIEFRKDLVFNYLKDSSIPDLKKLLEHYHLTVHSWNAIELFSLCSEQEFNSILEYTERLMEIGKEIKCELIIAVPSFTNEFSLPRSKIIKKTVKRFQSIRKLAAGFDFKVGFEPLGFPTCSVRKIDDALEILELSEEDGLPESGLVIDTFHFFLAGYKPGDLLSVPRDRVWLVHFNDAIRKPLSTLQDGDRVFPGDGFFNLDGFSQALNDSRYDGVISLELFNEDYWNADPFEIAKVGLDRLKMYFDI